MRKPSCMHPNSCLNKLKSGRVGDDIYQISTALSYVGSDKKIIYVFSTEGNVNVTPMVGPFLSQNQNLNRLGDAL